MKRLENRPFALIGINSDRDRTELKKVLEEEKITWRSFWNGPNGTRGPISAEWRVNGWPTLYLIDHNGNIIGDDADDAKIEKAVKAAEAARKK